MHWMTWTRKGRITYEIIDVDESKHYCIGGFYVIVRLNRGDCQSRKIYIKTLIVNSSDADSGTIARAKTKIIVCLFVCMMSFNWRKNSSFVWSKTVAKYRTQFYIETINMHNEKMWSSIQEFMLFIFFFFFAFFHSFS